MGLPIETGGNDIENQEKSSQLQSGIRSLFALMQFASSGNGGRAAGE